LSLGMGAMLTYGSYIGRRISIPQAALQITALDTLIALMACVIMFSIINSSGIEVAKSATILFTTIPTVLVKLPGADLVIALFHILSRESHTLPLFEGRIDEDKLRRLLATVVDGATASGWYLCGPSGMVAAARFVLAERGVRESDIHDELFYAGGDAPVSVAEDDSEGATVRFTLAGRTSTVVVDPEGAPILDHVLAVRPDGPFSCRSGACASCRAKVTTGEVRMDRNWSLNQEEVDAGQILTCQSHPVSDVVELTYDV
jgi:ferredoxin